MKRPNYNFVPKKPNRPSPVAGVTEMCGYSWDMPFEIRAPYEGIDKYSTVLPIVFAQLEATHVDLEISLPILTSNNFQGKLQDAIDDARKLLAAYADEGLIDAANKSTIKAHADLAQDYLNKAKNLEKYWDQYSSHAGVGPVGWSLENEGFARGCDGKVHPAEGSFYTMTPDGPGTVTYGCPTQKATDEHNADREMFRKLMEAALLNARCAQEGAAFVGSYNRNRKSKAGVGTGVKYRPAGPQAAPHQAATATRAAVIHGAAAGGSTTAPEEEPESQEGGAVTQTAPAAKKKKDNTLLLAGAAVLGLLALKR